MRSLIILSLVLLVSARQYTLDAEGADADLQTEGPTPVPLTPPQRLAIASKKATCPFIGSIVNQGLLPVLQSTDRPLASVDVLTALGNTGAGSNLGYVLKFFALGNHAQMAAENGKVLSQPTPLGFFSLDFPGSQGSHPGHSGILQGDWRVINTGRFDAAAWGRLAAKAKNGKITRSAIGQFIGENLFADKTSKVADAAVAELLAKDALTAFAQLGISVSRVLTQGRSASEAEVRNVAIALTKLLGENNLIGSCGEFGLLAAFLANSPNTSSAGLFDVSYSLAEVQSMFQRFTLPAGWDKWKKTGQDWIISTSKLLVSAARRYHELKKGKF